jgi:ABC-type multidrug transport system ATPase subunit
MSKSGALQMGLPVIELHNVSKSYGKLHAVRDLTLMVPKQSVYGFLGPNGAGKTTTIRLLLGLQQVDAGNIALFGRPLTQDRISLLCRVGSLVDSPSLYMHLTGAENLEVHRRLLALPKSSIADALAMVNLSSVAGRLVRHYSHGMRQRLGMAMALLGNPELLILDEPTNGLDPEGIHEIRTLVRQLPKYRGVTIFLSSHLLSEVEQVATHIAILSQGKLRFEGTAGDLKSRAFSIVVHVDQPERARALLERAGCKVRSQHQQLNIEPAAHFGPAEINTMLVGANLSVSHLALQAATLEELFLELTSGLGRPVEVSE